MPSQILNFLGLIVNVADSSQSITKLLKTNHYIYGSEVSIGSFDNIEKGLKGVILCTLWDALSVIGMCTVLKENSVARKAIDLNFRVRRNWQAPKMVAAKELPKSGLEFVQVRSNSDTRDACWNSDHSNVQHSFFILPPHSNHGP